MMGMWLVGQCSKTLKFLLKIPGVSRARRYFEDRLIGEPKMMMYEYIYKCVFYVYHFPVYIVLYCFSTLSFDNSIV